MQFRGLHDRLSQALYRQRQQDMIFERWLLTGRASARSGFMNVAAMTGPLG